jgi:hypothetical protein
MMEITNDLRQNGNERKELIARDWYRRLSVKEEWKSSAGE